MGYSAVKSVYEPRFVGKYNLHLQGGKSADQETSVLSIWLGRISVSRDTGWR
jgi:hypothetical protein